MVMFKVNVVILFLMRSPWEEHVHQFVGVFMYVSKLTVCRPMDSSELFASSYYGSFVVPQSLPLPTCLPPPTHKDLTLVIHFWIGRIKYYCVVKGYQI